MATTTKTQDTTLRNAFGQVQNINQIITLQNVDDIYLAFDHFFPEGTVYKFDTPYSKGNFYWNNQQEFKEYVKEETGIDIRDGNDRRAIKDAQRKFSDIAEGKAEVEMKGAEEPVAPANRPTKDTLELLEQQKEFTDTERARLKEMSDREVRTAIEQKIRIADKQKAIREQQTKLADLKKSLEGKKIYVKVTAPEPSPEVKSLKEQASASPTRFYKETAQYFESQIKNPEIPQDQKTLMSQQAALSTYNSLNGNSEFTKAATIQTLTDPNIVGRIDGITQAEQALLITTAKAELAERLSSIETYKNLVDTQKIDGVKSLSEIKVEYSAIPQPGFREVDIYNEIVQPRIDLLKDQDNILSDFQLPLDIGENKLKSAVLKSVENRIVQEVAKLPVDSAGARLFSQPAIQLGMKSIGFTAPALIGPTAEVMAIENSVLGNLLVSTGLGDIAFTLQGMTGLNFGIMEIAPSVGIQQLAGGVTMMGGDTALTIGMEMAAAPVYAEATFAGAELIGVGAETISGVTSAATTTITGLGTEAATTAATTAVTTAATTATEATVATAATTAGATTISGAAAGTAIAPIIGTIIGAVLGFIASLVGPKIIERLKEGFKKIGKGIVIGSGALLGALISPGGSWIMGAFLGGTIATGAVIAMTGGLPALGAAASSTATGLIGAGSVAFETALVGIGAPIVAFLLGFPVVIALIIFIINSGAYVVPPKISDAPFAGIGGGGGGLGPDGLCSTEKGPVEGISSPSSNSDIANRAYKISYDLYKGFWCFWNRSPVSPEKYRKYFPNDVLTYPLGYPQLFDYEGYLAHPMPPSNFQGNLFWCTWLVIKAYNETGHPTPPSIYSPSMLNDFMARNKAVEAGKATYGPPSATQAANGYKQLFPGSVVFFHVTTGQNRINHVGIVYQVDRNGFQFVQSNAPVKSQSAHFIYAYPVTQKVGGTMEIKYFGIP